MARTKREYMILDAVTPVAIVGSTNTTPIQITATAHGLTNGQRVLVIGHTTNTNANGIYKVASALANSFTLVDEFTGAAIAGNGVGGAAGVVMAAPQVVNVEYHSDLDLQFDTTGSATLTAKVAISNGLPFSQKTATKSMPNFGATVSTNNPYSFAQVVNLADGVSTNGGTGIALTGTDFHNIYEVNINAAEFLTVIPTAWTQGAITVKLTAFTENTDL